MPDKDLNMRKAQKAITEVFKPIMGIDPQFEDTDDGNILVHASLFNPVNKDKRIGFELLLIPCGNLYISFMCDEFYETKEIHEKINKFNETNLGIFKAYMDHDEYANKVFFEYNVVDVFDYDTLANHFSIALNALFGTSKINTLFKEILTINEVDHE